MLKRLRHLVPLGLLALALYFLAKPPLVLDHLRLLAFDTFQNLEPRAYQPAPVRIVDLDDESLHRLGQWPWPRDKVAALIKRLQDLGAASIALDIVFAEPDRTSPNRLLAELPDASRTPQLTEMLGALPDHDATLAGQIGKGGVVLGVALTNDNDNDVVMNYTMPFGGTDPRRFVLGHFRGAVVPLPELTKTAAGIASINFIPDIDGVERLVPLVFRQKDRLVPGLAAEALRVASGARSIALKASDASGEGIAGWQQQTGIVAARIGPFTIPTDPAGRLWLHDTGHVASRYIPAWRVMEPSFDRAKLDGMIVFVGTSAVGLFDARPTPLDPVMPGVEVHAQIAEQIALGDRLDRPDWARGAEFLFAALTGLLLIVLVELIPPVLVSLVGVLAIAGVIGASWYGYVHFHFLTDPLLPSLIVLVIYLSSSGLRFLAAERERRWVRSAFSQYLSPVLVEQLAKAPERLTLGGEMRDVTLMFCDLRGFTSISEGLDPQAVTKFINGFLTPMTGIVLEHRGTIDKYIGDCLMAFWNAPLDDADHGRHASEAALAMNAALPAINQKLADEAAAAGTKPLVVKIGIGLNSGDCCVGNMGSEQRFDYSVIGDPVNLASRLESQSKTYGVVIIVSEQTRSAAPELAALELDLIMVKGTSRPERIFTLLGDAAFAASPEFLAWKAAHDRMLELYRARDWDDAVLALEEVRRQSGGRISGLYDLYAFRLKRYRAEPPAVDWAGVYVPREHLAEHLV